MGHAWGAIGQIALSMFYPLLIAGLAHQHAKAAAYTANIHNEALQQVANTALGLVSTLAQAGAAQAGHWSEVHAGIPAAVGTSLVTAIATGQVPSDDSSTPVAPAAQGQ